MNHFVRHGVEKVEERVISKKDFDRISEVYCCNKMEVEILAAKKKIYDLDNAIDFTREQVKKNHKEAVIEFWEDIIQGLEGYEFDNHKVDKLYIDSFSIGDIIISVDLGHRYEWFNMFMTDPDEFKKRFTKSC